MGYRQRPRVTVLTGAGISTDSGIPDFRGPDGVWTRNPAAEKLFDIDHYLASAETRRRSWLARRENPAWDAEPNAGHEALVRLEEAGLLRALITQNIDRLHQRAGSSSTTVLELHGNMVETRCIGCGVMGSTADALARVDAGDTDPHCVDCGELLKTATVMFGESLDPAVLSAAVEATAESNVFVAIGTSLTVHPAAGLVDIALERGADLVIMNAQPTPYDGFASRIVRQPISDALPLFVDELIALADRSA